VTYALARIWLVAVFTLGLLAAFHVFEIDYASTHHGLNLSPNWLHWLGTNSAGQDVAARTLAACGQLVRNIVPGAILAMILGFSLGMLSGLSINSKFDVSLTWLMDVLESLPSTLMLIALSLSLSHIPFARALILGLVFWPNVARHVRTRTASLADQTFVLGARGLGLSSTAIALGQVLPNLWPSIRVQVFMCFLACLDGDLILGFIGLPGSVKPSFGGMIAEGLYNALFWNFNTLLVGLGLVGCTLASLVCVIRHLQSNSKLSML
jgi:ABC-type dipeptide/oligopeptide/nickel transport system permease subunit